MLAISCEAGKVEISPKRIMRNSNESPFHRERRGNITRSLYTLLTGLVPVLGLFGCDAIVRPDCKSPDTEMRQRLLRGAFENLLADSRTPRAAFKLARHTMSADCCRIYWKGSTPSAGEIAPEFENSGYVVSIAWIPPKEYPEQGSWYAGFDCAGNLMHSHN